MFSLTLAISDLCLFWAAPMEPPCRVLNYCVVQSTGGNTMVKKLALAATAVALLFSTASADFYIVQEKATKHCKVVETKPTETTWVQVGPAAFKTQSDAEKQIKTVCVEK
jgi:hypothetical protein